MDDADLRKDGHDFWLIINNYCWKKINFRHSLSSCATFSNRPSVLQLWSLATWFPAGTTLVTPRTGRQRKPENDFSFSANKPLCFTLHIKRVKTQTGHKELRGPVCPLWHHKDVFTTQTPLKAQWKTYKLFICVEFTFRIKTLRFV